jgi:hypothetical protein
MAHARPHRLILHACCVCPSCPVSHHHVLGAVLDLEAVHVHRQLEVRKYPRHTPQVPDVFDLVGPATAVTAVLGAKQAFHKLLCSSPSTRRRGAALWDGQQLAWEFP